MTKSTITREQLEEWVAQFDVDGGCDATDRQLEALIRQSLAAMESEPVAWTWHYREQWHVTNDKCRAEFVAKDGDVAVLPLYRHAQPVPVVSADLLHTAASAIEDLLEHTDPNTSYYSGVWADVPGKLRAAMFQAKSLTGNSPVIGIDLASGPDRTVEVHYVAPPGYVMVPKEPTEAMMLHNSGCQHHAWDDPDCAMRQTRRLIWSHMLAAAPQEVK
ncbi:hypothetical protein ACY0JH_14370 [Klebsiella variicola]